MTLSTVVGSQDFARCPISDPQFQKIRARHSTLASTGCSKEFCQAGRAVHTDEPRIGENRALLEVELEAQEFLQDAHREGFYGAEDAFQERLGQVLGEIRAGATVGIVRINRSKALIGGSWTQTSRELEFGVRRAWRNARKCIMRSHCEELKLCDLRTVRSSKQMAEELLGGIQKAFNHGSIQPTVFVFPPRAANCRGPMILNHQILQFAGYEDIDGSVIGDPASVEVTKAVIDLGWRPPKTRGRWDLLPLVTMADGDRPYVAELPADIRKLVDIRHPQYIEEFGTLNLKWVAFPALTRLGFDIGGVQYTAAPFIGWFMDAEIGVRDLADTFRYNVLPDVVHALGMLKGRLNDDIEEFEELPEYEKLVLLSKAQAELNYAVHWSYLQAKVMMTDSLTASMKWCRYDDDFRNKNGFRLPADPYWLAPPQGSIIPLWHRGGAPNYQPKPMICKHIQNPVKAWRREQRRGHTSKPLLEYISSVSEYKIGPTRTPTEENTILSNLAQVKPPLPLQTTVKGIFCPQDNPGRSIAIYFCSAGTVAEKLASKLHRWIQKLVRNSSVTSLEPRVEPLNNMTDLDLTANKIILVVVSSTGQGEIPHNGSAFVELCGQLLSRSSSNLRKDLKFAVFGNGDSRYSTTFNGAAIQINNLMKGLGGIPLAGGLSNGDTAIDPLPLRALKKWFTKLEPSVNEGALQWIQRPGAIPIAKNKFASAVTVSVVPIEDGAQQYDDYQQQLLLTLKDAMLISTSPEARREEPKSLLLGLTIGDEPFEEMSCIQILPINAISKVRRALLALHIEEHATLDLPIDGENPSYSKYLTEFVDLELPFLKLEWLEPSHYETNLGLTKESLSKLSVLEVLECLDSKGLFPLSDTIDLQRKICLDMPLLRTRTYSLASSPTYTARFKKPTTEPNRQISIVAKTIPAGRFSSTFLTDTSLPSRLKYRLVDSICGRQLRANHLAPCIIVATGAGFGPVRAFLQWRIAAAVAVGRTLPPLKRGISLFLGLKECDVELTLDVVNEALALELIDVLDIVVSNPLKRRVYDEIGQYRTLVRGKVVETRGLVFVCASRAAAEGTKRVCEQVLGREGMRRLGERYVEEVF